MTYLTFVLSYKDSDKWRPRIELLKANLAENMPEAELMIMESEPYCKSLNRGIKAAKGEFVCATNRDAILSGEVFDLLKRKELKHGVVYRIDRREVKEPIRYPTTPQEAYAYCNGNETKVHSRWESYHPRPHPDLWYFPRPVPHSNASGDFILMAKDDWLKLRGFPELSDSGTGLHTDSIVMHNAIWSGMKQRILDRPMKLWHISHERNARSAVPVPGLLPIYFRMREPAILNGDAWGVS
jgi:hypothetical protein